MKYQLTLQHIDLSDMDREHLDECLNRLEKHVPIPFVTDVVMSRDTHHAKGEVITCKINVQNGRKVFHVDRSAETVATAIDAATQALKQELLKAKTKELDSRRS